MSKKKKKCGQTTQIEKRVENSTMYCHRRKSRVRINVDKEEGNKCTCVDYPFSPSYVP